MSHFSASPGLNDPSKSRLIRLSWIRAITRAANRAVLMCGSRVSGSALKAITSVPPFCGAPLGALATVGWPLATVAWPLGTVGCGAGGAAGAQPAAANAKHTANACTKRRIALELLSVWRARPRAYHRPTGLPTIGPLTGID